MLTIESFSGMIADIEWRPILRQSYRVHILKTADDTPYGIFAEADFCSEHERGLGDLHRFMGCEGAVEGVGRYVPSPRRVEQGGFAILTREKVWARIEGRRRSSTRNVLSSRAGLYDGGDGYIGEGQPMSCLFDDRDFRLSAGTDEADELLARIAQHASRGDVMVMMGGSAKTPSTAEGFW